jgi:hypothetical protein
MDRLPQYHLKNQSLALPMKLSNLLTYLEKNAKYEPSHADWWMSLNHPAA